MVKYTQYLTILQQNGVVQRLSAYFCSKIDKNVDETWNYLCPDVYVCIHKYIDRFISSVHDLSRDNRDATASGRNQITLPSPSISTCIDVVAKLQYCNNNNNKDTKLILYTCMNRLHTTHTHAHTRTRRTHTCRYASRCIFSSRSFLSGLFQSDDYETHCGCL